MATATSTVLFAGPFCGELGWELLCFQAYVRKLVRNSSFSYVIISSRPGHEVLYEDFAHAYVAFTPPPDRMPDGHILHGTDPEEFIHLVPAGSSWLNPMKMKADWSRGCPVVHDQEFIPFGKAVEKDFDVLIHARNRQFEATKGRNWSKESWQDLIQRMPNKWRVGWIGTKEEALCCGHEDLRGIPLAQLIQYMRRARIVIGPSSGPMHLASLCETPHLVWSGNGRDVIRYAELWNPFEVRHSMVQTWQPPVDEIFNRVKAMIG